MFKLRHHTSYCYVGFSFGGGVQSTALALLIKHEPEFLIKKIGHIPDGVFFADTKAEPKKVYDHVNLLKKQGVIGDTFHTVYGADLSDIENSFHLPFYTQINGSIGVIKRQCTNVAKIVPVRRAMLKDCLIKTGKKPHFKNRIMGQWLGISIDEIGRMKQSRYKNTENIYPLIELNWDRSRCFHYCQSHGITPPKSSCYHCPFRSDWVTFSKDSPDDFEKACQYDELIRTNSKTGAKSPVYISRDLRSLRESVAFKSLQNPLFPDGSDECDGICFT